MQSATWQSQGAVASTRGRNTNVSCGTSAGKLVFAWSQRIQSLNHTVTNADCIRWTIHTHACSIQAALQPGARWARTLFASTGNCPCRSLAFCTYAPDKFTKNSKRELLMAGFLFSERAISSAPGSTCARAPDSIACVNHGWHENLLSESH